MTIKKKKKQLNSKSEALWKKLAKIRAMDVCEFCHNPHPTLNVHHIVGKGRCRILRWDLANAMVLCPTHHTFGEISAHSKDYFGLVAFNDWLGKHIGKKRLDYLQARKFKTEKTTIDFLGEEYRNLQELEKMMVEMDKYQQTSSDALLTSLAS